jgi:hypothetical protein
MKINPRINYSIGVLNQQVHRMMIPSYIKGIGIGPLLDQAVTQYTVPSESVYTLVDLFHMLLCYSLIGFTQYPIMTK